MLWGGHSRESSEKMRKSLGDCRFLPPLIPVHGCAYFIAHSEQALDVGGTSQVKRGYLSSRRRFISSTISNTFVGSCSFAACSHSSCQRSLVLPCTESHQFTP